jgi:hypothetical protein
MRAGMLAHVQMRRLQITKVSFRQPCHDLVPDSAQRRLVLVMPARVRGRH